MDDSEDKKFKRKAIASSDWIQNPFERVNHSTNFEDYACSSDDTSLLYTSDSMLNKPKTDKIIKTDSFPNSNNKQSNKYVPKFEANVTPIISHLLADQRDNSFVESCLSAGNSSAEVTPAGTPQSSPYTLRKMIENNNKVMPRTNDQNSSLSINPKRWFYTGFFNADQNKPIINDKTCNSIPRNPSLKNLSVSNFDINAVGPTSW